MTVQRMSGRDLAQVMDWAAAEGWNPGVEDAAAFHAADPEGFFVKIVDGQPVAAISVVNHDADFAFLGLYLCLPEHRGRGFGLDVWRAGMAHAGGRCVGLDGVPDQQANYERSGFVRAGRTVRYQGARLGPAGRMWPVRAETVLQADLRASGVARAQFASAWFADTDSRRSLALDGYAQAFATFRTCRQGVKIGPLQAETLEQAEALLGAVPTEFGDGPVFIDVPDTAPQLAKLLSTHGFEPVFETARMYCGTPPRADPPPFYAVATLELG
jgi:hypothetical protein